MSGCSSRRWRRGGRHGGRAAGWPRRTAAVAAVRRRWNQRAGSGGAAPAERAAGQRRRLGGDGGRCSVRARRGRRFGVPSDLRGGACRDRFAQSPTNSPSAVIPPACGGVSGGSRADRHYGFEPCMWFLSALRSDGPARLGRACDDVPGACVEDGGRPNCLTSTGAPAPAPECVRQREGRLWWRRRGRCVACVRWWGLGWRRWRAWRRWGRRSVRDATAVRRSLQLPRDLRGASAGQLRAPGWASPYATAGSVMASRSLRSAPAIYTIKCGYDRRARWCGPSAARTPGLVRELLQQELDRPGDAAQLRAADCLPGRRRHRLTAAACAADPARTLL